MPAESFHYRPVFGLILTGVVFVLCLIGLGSFAVAGEWADHARAAWPLLFAGTLVAAVFWRPCIVITDSGVRVVNVFRTYEIPWPAIQRIDTRYAVTLFTSSRRIAVWAAPSPGIRGATSISRRDVSNLTESSYGPGNTVRPGDSASFPSGQVAFVLRKRWEELRDHGVAGESGTVGALSGTADDRVGMKTHGATIVALAVLGAATLVSSAL